MSKAEEEQSAMEVFGYQLQPGMIVYSSPRGFNFVLLVENLGVDGEKDSVGRRYDGQTPQHRDHPEFCRWLVLGKGNRAPHTTTFHKNQAYPVLTSRQNAPQTKDKLVPGFFGFDPRRRYLKGRELQPGMTIHHFSSKEPFGVLCEKVSPGPIAKNFDEEFYDLPDTLPPMTTSWRIDGHLVKDVIDIYDDERYWVLLPETPFIPL